MEVTGLAAGLAMVAKFTGILIVPMLLLLSVAEALRCLPEAYLWGLANTKKTEWEYTSYFFGKVYRHGPWQYFPAAFSSSRRLPC